MTCLNAIKNQLMKILYPFVEAFVEFGITTNANPLLQNVVKNHYGSSVGHRQQLAELFQALSAVIPRINNLVCAENVAMSDTIIISAVYIAIGPFFVVDAGGDADSKSKKDNGVIKTLGKSAMRGLRLDALSLIRSVRSSFFIHSFKPLFLIHESRFLPITRTNDHGLLKRF
jgi:cohesin loading factor subunit SCC2